MNFRAHSYFRNVSIYIEAERVMLGLTPKVLRRWNGEWQVFDPPETLGIEKHLTWRVVCERLSPDSRDDPVCFRFARSDYKGELPAREYTPQATLATILSFPDRYRQPLLPLD